MEPFDDMFPNDIYELYNERLIADQPFVDTIIASIKFEMYYNIQEGLDYWFLYDADEWLINQDNKQKVRVIDQVIKHFRSRGIRVYIDNTFKFNYDTTQITGAGFNTGTAPNTVMRVEWIVRNGQEYMKAYL